jgi:hypothetical protein
MDAIRRAASLFRSGAHKEATAALEEAQSIASPEIVHIGTQLLQESAPDDSCYVRFYAARVVRGAVIRDWGTHWKSSSQDILSFTGNFLTTTAAELVLPFNKPLLSEMATLWAVVWKLQCAEGDDAPFEALRVAVSGLLQLADTADTGDVLPMRIIVRVVLLSLVEEFGLYQAQSHARVLSLSAHERCRRGFKDLILLPLAQHCFRWGLQMDVENEKSVSALIQLWNALLCWNFSNAAIGVSSSTADRIPDVLSCEGDGWQELFGRGVAHHETGALVSVLEILRNWAAALSQQNVSSAQQESCNLLLQCILQLTGLTAAEWPLELRFAHYERCTSLLYSMMQQSSDLSSWNTLCASLHRLVTSIGCVECIFLHERTCTMLLQPLVALTTHVIGTTHAADRDPTDDEARIESLDHLLKTWLELITKAFSDVSVLVGLSDALREALSSGAAQVFRTFVEAKLAECVRLSSSTNDAPESSFSTEYAESQTQLLALLGREQPAATATFLGSTLRQLYDQFSAHLSHRQTCPEGLSEALWFVLSVAAHFVADGSESERNAIPNSIVTHALRWEREYPDDEAAQERSNEVLILIQLVVKCALDIVPLAPSGLVSPGVCQALLMFLRHVCGAYLFPDDSLLMDFSNIFTTAFNGGVALGDAALQVTVGCLTTFPYDQDVTKAATTLLSALTEKPREFGEWVSTHSHFAFLVQLASGNANGVELPGVVKGRVFGFLVSVCPLENVTAAVVTPIATALGSVLFRAGQTPTGQLLDINSVVSAVDSLAGAFTALRTEDHTKTVFASLAPLVDASATIVQHHNSHKPLLAAILRMMNTIVVSCSFLASSSFIHVVRIGIVCIQVTKAAMDESRVNAARLRSDAASLEEDERVDVLTAAATFVESVATWGLLDMNCDDGFDASGTAGPDMIADLSVRGLLVVLTYCDQHVLAIPQLRDTVFNLLQEVSSTYKARFLSASPEEASALLAATDFALASSVPSLNRAGYKVMESIASYCCQNNVQGFDLLDKFSCSVATVMATADVDSSVFPSVAATLFALGGACGPETLVAVIYQVFSTSPLLAWPFQALQKLLTSTNFRTHSRDLRSKFVRDVEAVLLMVRGTKIS